MVAGHFNAKWALNCCVSTLRWQVLPGWNTQKIAHKRQIVQYTYMQHCITHKHGSCKWVPVNCYHALGKDTPVQFVRATLHAHTASQHHTTYISTTCTTANNTPRPDKSIVSTTVQISPDPYLWYLPLTSNWNRVQEVWGSLTALVEAADITCHTKEAT